MSEVSPETAAPEMWRKKPVEVQAWQWDSEDAAYSIAEWCGGDYAPHTAGPSSQFSDGEDWGLLVIETLEGEMTAAPGDFIIRGVVGEFYPCKPDIFEATYERATSPGQPTPPTAGADTSAGGL